jgi:hypothetical protein
MRLAVACFVGALVIRLALVLADVSTLVAYVMLPTRMDSLAAGAFLALCIRGPGGTSVLGRWPRWVLSGSAVVVVGLYLREGRLRLRGSAGHDRRLYRHRGGRRFADCR